MRLKASMVIVAVCLTAAAGTTVLAQEYPSRTIRVVVPLTAGSGADLVGRIIAKHVGTGLGQAMVVENLAGAGGQIGTLAVVKAPADGYTVMIQSASHGANPALYKSLPYDSLKDLVDVALLGMTPYVMVVTPNGPYRTLKALVDAAQAKPEQIPYASVGVGSVTHLAAEYFAQKAGIKMMHIPYKGGPEALRDVAAGRVAFYMSPINTAIGMIRDGKVAPLCVSTLNRVPVLPDTPTVAEQGVAGFSMTLWYGMWVRSGTPQPIIQKLNAQVNQTLQLPALREQYASLGVDPVPMKPEEFAKFVREEMATNKAIVKQANIELQ